MPAVRVLSACLLGAAMLAASACVPSSRAPMKINYYTLEYPAPQPGGAAVDATLLVRRFAAAPDYDTQALVYREGPNLRQEYAYHRWRTNPADQMTYHLRRDLAASGLFTAVLDRGTDAVADYALEGSVDEFYEQDAEDAWRAVCAVTVTLLRAQEPDATRQVAFQRVYRAEAPAQRRNPQALAEAMSRAVADISARVVSDVRAAVAADTTI